VENVEDVVKKGDLLTAKCLGVDEKGRVKMSRRAWLRDEKAREAEEANGGSVEEVTTPLV
jgi:polyribonucleotide nucleotidyltransferase